MNFEVKGEETGIYGYVWNTSIIWHILVIKITENVVELKDKCGQLSVKGKFLHVTSRKIEWRFKMIIDIF